MFSPSRKQSLLTWSKSKSQPSFDRETWEGGEESLLPELEIFGWLRFHETLLGALQADRHNTFEIHYLKKGHLNWWVEDMTFEFRPGAVIIIPPGKLHGGDEESLQPCEQLWLRISLDADSLPGMSKEEAAILRGEFDAMRQTTFPVSTMVGDYFDGLLTEHRTRDPLSGVIARSLLQALLSTIIRDYKVFTTQSRSEPLVTWRIRRALEILATDAEEHTPTVAALAEQVGLSESGFRQRFKAEIGFSPHEYIVSQRINEARWRLTHTKDDITRVALDLGFASSQYFATVFSAPGGDVSRRLPQDA